MTSSSTVLALTLAFAVSSARSINCQQVRELEVGVQPPAATSIGGTHPSGRSLALKSIQGSIFGSLLGGVAGLTVDQAYCSRHHGHEQGFIFGPCTFYYNEGFGAGWFGGAIIGSTLGAVRVAEKRGCPRREAIWRALGGAAAGVAPGVGVAMRRSGKYPPSQSMIIATSPLLAGIGAAAALVGCHAR